MKLLRKGKSYECRVNSFKPGGYIEIPENWKTTELKQNDYYTQLQTLEYINFQNYLNEYAKKWKEYINASDNWEYRDIEGDYPIATNVWSERNRIPIYKIPGSIMLKVFPGYTWGDNLTFDPNVNYYTIRNNKGLYAIIPNNSYISLLMNYSFALLDELQKALHPTKLASDMTALVSNIPIQHGVVPMQKKPEALVYPLQALLWLDTKSDYEHKLAQNRYNFNNWQQRYNYWLDVENTTRDRITRPFVVTNYVRATGDAASGYDNWFSSFFDPNKQGMWIGPEGKAFLLNHPFASGLLDLGVDMFGAKYIPKIGKGFKTGINASKNRPLFSLSEEDIPSLFKTDNKVDLMKLYDYYFTKKPKKDALLKFARNEELTSLEGAVIADYNVQKNTVKGLEELFEDTIFKKTPKEYFADKKIDFNKFQKELKEGNYVSVDQRFITDTMGEGFKGYFNPDDNLIVISNGVDVWQVAPHEFRHMLDKIKKLPLEQVKMLEEAFTKDFKTLPEWVPETDTLHGYTLMEKEMVTTNYDTWLKLMPKHLHKESLELQNKFIDKVSDAKIVEALEKSNGYGKRYVKRMREQYGRVPPEVIKALRRSLKYVGMSTAVLYGTSNKK